MSTPLGTETSGAGALDASPRRDGDRAGPLGRLNAWRGAEAVAPRVYQQHQIFWACLVFGGIGLYVANNVSRASQVNLFNNWMYLTILSTGFYLVWGVAGRFSFGHVFMAAVGAYTTAWAARDLHPWLAVVVAVAIATVVAFAVGYLLRRSEHFFFAMATLGVAEIGLRVFREWDAFTAAQSGEVGGIPALDLLGKEFRTGRDNFWLFLGAAFLVMLLVMFLQRSPAHRDAMATRGSPVVAETMGVPVDRLRVTMFVVGSVIAAFGGALYAHWNRYISTESFGIEPSIAVFVIVILGGLRSPWGGLVGAAFYVWVPELLSSYERYSEVIYGVLLVLVILAIPNGLVGAITRLVGAGTRSLRGVTRRTAGGTRA